MVLFRPITALMDSYKGLYVKYTGPSNRVLTINREYLRLEKGAIGVCYSVRGPKMFLAFKEDGGKQSPMKSSFGGEAQWKHHVEVYPFEEPNSWEIEMDL